MVREFKPDVVVGVGGYASGPIGKVATNAGIPLVLQEQNSYAGVTNKLLAKKAAKICVAYEGMERFFPQEKIIFTGNPVRKDLLNAVSERAEGIAFYGLNANKKTVLVTGGSLGAGSINKAMVRWLEKIAGWKDVQVIWQCGQTGREECRRQIEEIDEYCQTETTDKHLDSDSCLQEKERKGEQQGDSTHYHIIIEAILQHQLHLYRLGHQTMEEVCLNTKGPLRQHHRWQQDGTRHIEGSHSHLIPYLLSRFCR